MLAYVLIGCLVVPLLLLIADVMSPNKKAHSVAARPQSAPRPHVTADTTARRAVLEPADAEAPRAPRIAPGDGMVYRGPLRGTR